VRLTFQAPDPDAHRCRRATELRPNSGRARTRAQRGSKIGVQR
jgi:hypothetical protein